MDIIKHIEQMLEQVSSNPTSIDTTIPLDVNVVTPTNALTVLITSVDGGTP